MGRLDGIVSKAPRNVRALLDRALHGKEVDARGIHELLTADADEASFTAIRTVAHELRKMQAGPLVHYVVNRNINFTNVCVKRCGFCAFSRDAKNSGESYLLPIDEIVRRAKQAAEFGATEVCIQAGLPPNMDGDHYVRVCGTVKDALPTLHIHAFSPEEVWYGAKRRNSSIKEHLQDLKAAGLGSLPGTSAEILDQDLRNRISPGRIPVTKWIEVIRTAHQEGLKTSATVMYGHAETKEQLASHLVLLRDIQKETAGFTEFVPLSFVHEQAPMFLQKYENLSAGPSWNERILVHSVARIALGRTFGNIQASWVKEGFQGAAELLLSGANDLGGTLINESISTSAGAEHGQLARPSHLRRIAREQGFTPAERTTVYDTLRLFQSEDDDPTNEPLEGITDSDARRLFGSYADLIQSKKYRYTPELNHT